MNNTGQDDARDCPQEISASTEQPVDVLASWIAHVLEREMETSLEHLRVLCHGIEAQLAAWPRGILQAAIETAAAAVASIDHQVLLKASWLDRLTGRQAARRAQFARAAEAARAGIAHLKSVAGPLHTKHPMHLSGTRRVMLELRMEEGEVRQRLAQVASWHAQLWEVLLQRRATGPAAESEYVERLFRLVDRWAVRIEQAEDRADNAIEVAQAAEAVLAARTRVLEIYRTELCACEAEWNARVTRLTQTPPAEGSFGPASKSIQELSTRIELALHELMSAMADHTAREQVFDEALLQVQATASSHSGLRPD